MVWDSSKGLVVSVLPLVSTSGLLDLVFIKVILPVQF